MGFRLSPATDFASWTGLIQGKSAGESGLQVAPLAVDDATLERPVSVGFP
jgi:hypothetical protein